LKTSVNNDERRTLQEILRDDIEFYEQARKEYDQRLSTPQIKAFVAKTASIAKALRTTMGRYLAVQKSSLKAPNSPSAP
jgi:hypothetical protein